MGIIEAILQIASLVCIIVFALNYRRKPAFLGPLGYWIIGLSSVTFLIQILGFAFEKIGAERLVLVSAGLIGTPLVALYWVGVWNRMKPNRKDQK